MQGRKKLPVVFSGENRQTGQAFAQLPEPPTWMTPGAKQRFVEVVAQLDALGALAATDRGLVERYSTTYDRWRAAEMALAATGEAVHYSRLVNRAGNPASAVALPAMMQCSKAHDQLTKLESMLGLCPTERTRLPITRDPGPVDEMDRLLLQQAQFDAGACTVKTG